VATPARRCANTVVRRVFEHGAYTDRAFRAEAERADLSARDRAFAMRLAYGVVQRRATLDHVLGSLADREVERLDAPVLAALRLGAYQLLFMDGVADHAAVTESVDLAREAGSRGHGLVNAVLRRTAREGRALLDALDESTPETAALRHSYPAWTAAMWWEQLGPAAALALMAASNAPAESAARVNTLRATSEEVRSELGREGVDVAAPDPMVPEALVLEQPYDLHGSSLFERGAIMPQSRASMLVARALDPRPGERVLDLCAAPGAKTTHLAALMGNDGEVVAVELEARRARDLERNAARLGVRNTGVVVGDAADPAFGTDYDRVLVDPPCSDLGTLQSRPDARWRKTPEQIVEVAQLQRRILDAGAGAVRPGGRLVYSTCTISPRENEAQVQDFLARHSNFEACDLSERFEPLAAHDRLFVQTLPHRERTDGFFIAAFERHG
jgi:16S rRNA (cytosine967-C5)-methyltransferase